MPEVNDKKVGTLDVLDHITKDRALPDGYDAWAFRTVRPDLSSSRDFKYPFPGKIAKAPGPFSNSAANCPRNVGDGICAATTYAGMASGGVTARTLLLVAYRNKDILGGTRESGKLRLRQFKVVEILDGERLLSNLAGADLYGANLARADLYGANLAGANLARADLAGAYLAGANLARADLAGAYLAGANLARADLAGAYLAGANLAGADLARADLAGANLYGANLAGANLYGANLARADLARADLAGAYLAGATGYSLPSGWKLTSSGIAVRA